jgi:hypothetical protein
LHSGRIDTSASMVASGAGSGGTSEATGGALGTVGTASDGALMMFKATCQAVVFI